MLQRTETKIALLPPFFRTHQCNTCFNNLHFFPLSARLLPQPHHDQPEVALTLWKLQLRAVMGQQHLSPAKEEFSL